MTTTLSPQWSTVEKVFFTKHDNIQNQSS